MMQPVKASLLIQKNSFLTSLKMDGPPGLSIFFACRISGLPQSQAASMNSNLLGKIIMNAGDNYVS